MENNIVKSSLVVIDSTESILSALFSNRILNESESYVNLFGGDN